MPVPSEPQRKLFRTDMTKILYRALLSLLLFTGVRQDVLAQLAVSDNHTAKELVDFLVGANISTLNPVLNCHPLHAGKFQAANSNLGLPEGIVLGTGEVRTNPILFTTGVNGASSLAVTNQNQSLNGDADLSNLIGGTQTLDACVLEFDFVADIDTTSVLSFRYIFGSEEYPLFTCSQFNDVFGFLITGPNGVPQNIALVPGTNIPVAINSINSGVASGSYSIATCNAMGPGSPFPQYFINNLAGGGTTVTLDGFTTVLEANAVIHPCDTYHMKLGIANAVDNGLQSAVFLEKNSFSIDSVFISLTDFIVSDSGYLVEGCTPAVITASRTNAGPKQKKICLEYTGTAVNGTDYPFLADSLVIAPGALSASLILDPLQDNIPEPGFETIKITRVNCCTRHPMDSLNIKVRDSLKIALLSPDVDICGSDSVLLHVAGDSAFAYSWSPAGFVRDPTSMKTFGFPAATTLFTVTASFKGCPEVSRSLLARVEPVPDVNVMADTTLCLKDPLRIRVSVSPDSFPSYSYQWTPATGLGDPFAKEPEFFLSTPGSYPFRLEVTTPLGCRGTDSITVTARPGIRITGLTQDFVAAYGSRAVLNVATSEPGYYAWFPTGMLDFPNTSSPQVRFVSDSAMFTVVVLNHWGCADTGYVRMNIDYRMAEFIPSVFTPNGDGLNDRFRIGSAGFQRLLEFRIFNRWGQEIFTTTDINAGWDGSYKGMPQESGVYHYLIRVARPDGSIRSYKGDVSLIR